MMTQAEVKMIKNANGYEYTAYAGEALSWSLGLYDTITEQRLGYPRMRAVIRAMIAHRPAQLAEERRGLLRASFDRVFGRAAKTQLSIIEAELSN